VSFKWAASAIAAIIVLLNTGQPLAETLTAYLAEAAEDEIEVRPV